MTWTKNDNIGPGWKTWSPTLNLVCDIANPTTTQCPGTISGLSWGDCRYTIFDKELYGFLNFTISNSGSYPYGGTKNHFDLQLPAPTAGVQGYGAGDKIIGTGFYHADTNPDKQGGVMLSTFSGTCQQAKFFFLKPEASLDQWAIDNLSYDWWWCAPWNAVTSSPIRQTKMMTNAWALRRLGSGTAAWSGSSQAWSAPTPTISVSVALRYMVQ
jgi:hypothetical protein